MKTWIRIVKNLLHVYSKTNYDKHTDSGAKSTARSMVNYDRDGAKSTARSKANYNRNPESGTK